MKTSKTKWAMIAALMVPGMMVNSCLTTLLMEVRDGAIAATGDFAQTTALELLENALNLEGTQ